MCMCVCLCVSVYFCVCLCTWVHEALQTPNVLSLFIKDFVTFTHHSLSFMQKLQLWQHKIVLGKHGVRTTNLRWEREVLHPVVL